MAHRLCLHPMSTTARCTRLFLLQAFDHMQLIAHGYRGSHWPPAGKDQHVPGWAAYSPQPASGVRPYAADRSWVSRQPLATCRERSTCMTRRPACSRLGSVFTTAWRAYLRTSLANSYVLPLLHSLPLPHPQRQASCRDATR